MQAFNDVEGLDLQEVKREISFPVAKEGTHTDEDMRVNRDAVISTQSGEKEILGLVSPKRHIIPYSDVMDWVTSVFDRARVNYKLNESVLTGKSKNLFQSYLFDTEVDNPDGQEISPMFLLRSSHVGSPLHIDIGTYRFVCSNGAIVGETMDSIHLKARDLDGLMTHDLLNDIERSLDRMMSVSRRYKELAEEEMTAYLTEFMNAPYVPVAFKKAMVDALDARGIIENRSESVLKGNDFLGMKIQDNAYLSRDNEEILKVLEVKNAWDLYNIGTELSTHQARNVQARDWYSKSLSEVFAA